MAPPRQPSGLERLRMAGGPLPPYRLKNPAWGSVEVPGELPPSKALRGLGQARPELGTEGWEVDLGEGRESWPIGVDPVVVAEEPPMELSDRREALAAAGVSPEEVAEIEQFFAGRNAPPRQPSGLERLRVAGKKPAEPEMTGKMPDGAVARNDRGAISGSGGPAGALTSLLLRAAPTPRAAPSSSTATPATGETSDKLPAAPEEPLPGVQVAPDGQGLTLTPEAFQAIATLSGDEQLMALGEQVTRRAKDDRAAKAAQAAFEAQTRLRERQLATGEGSLKEKKLSRLAADARAAAELRFKRDKLSADQKAREKAIADKLARSSTKDAYAMETRLRQEILRSPSVKEALAVGDAWERIQTVGKGPSPAGDLSLVFAYMKLLDPTSVVREKEQATAQNAAATPDKVRNLWNRVLAGEPLTPAQRKDFRKEADALYGAQRKRLGGFIDSYRKIVDDYGLDVDRVLAPALAAAPPGNSPPDNTSDEVPMRDPDTGNEVMMPADEVEDAEAGGWERVD